MNKKIYLLNLAKKFVLFFIFHFFTFNCFAGQFFVGTSINMQNDNYKIGSDLDKAIKQHAGTSTTNEDENSKEYWINEIFFSEYISYDLIKEWIDDCSSGANYYPPDKCSRKNNSIEFSSNEFRSYYRKLTLKHHPDKGGKREEFVRINNIADAILKETRNTDFSSLINYLKKTIENKGKPNSGSSSGYNQGSSSGYNQGSSSGYNQGSSSGYNQGSSSGYNQGSSSGYNQGSGLIRSLNNPKILASNFSGTLSLLGGYSAFINNFGFISEFGVDLNILGYTVGSNNKNEIELKSDFNLYLTQKVGYQFKKNMLYYITLGIGLKDGILKYENEFQTFKNINLILGVGNEFGIINNKLGIFTEFNNITSLSAIKTNKGEIQTNSYQFKVGVRYYL